MRPLSQNLVEIVKLLSDGEYHDGTSIGEHLKISRAAVWKLIKKLEQYKVPLTCTKGKGYKLESPLALLNTKKLKSQLRHRSIKIEILEKIPSTNDFLKPLSRSNKEIIACFAEAQTTGKGRLHRQWHSPFAENIYLSVLCPFEKDISELGGLSLVAALAICHALESIIDLHEKRLNVKWPNDILIDGCKLAGTLIEIEAESNGFCQVIIGVGINVNMQKALKKDIDQSWISLSKLTNQYIDRNTLGAEIIDSLVDYLERFSSKGLASFKQEWQKRDCLTDAMVSVISGSRKEKGICLGINNQGHLKIKTETGDTLTLSSGDTTLLK
jgi:BirA family biotin operon repressor/biotin-[acetyl-CoA-carboxylase] ligase